MLCRSLQAHQKKGKEPVRGTWSLPESKLHINYLELKPVFLALKEFQDFCSDKIALVPTDICIIHKQRRRHKVGPTFYPAVENLGLVYQKSCNSQSPTYLSLAGRGSRQTIQARPDHPKRVVSLFQRSSKQYVAGGTGVK